MERASRMEESSLVDRMMRCGEYVLEGGWLLTVLIVPAYFNVNGVRVFEPDKAILLRDLAAILSALALLCLTLRSLSRNERSGIERVMTPQPNGTPLLHTLLLIRDACRRRPTLLPMGLLALVTLLATATSILPAVSWQGSYARGQGALTMLGYLTLSLLVLGFIRTPAQVRRLTAAIALSGVVPAAYGWVQHYGRDPLPWQQPDLTARVPGTLGNPIFLGALLVMTIPLALYHLMLAVASRDAMKPLDAPACSRPQARALRLRVRLVACGWAAAVVIEAGGLFFTKSRGPFAGILVALVILGVGLAWAWRLRWLARGTLAVGSTVAVLLLGLNLLAVGPMHENSALRLLQWMPRSSGTSEVRLLIWRPALTLVARHLLLGCGPDTLLSCYYPVYPTALRHVEAPNAAPDRTHNILLDVAAETGLIGLIAFAIFLGVTARTLMSLVARADSARQRGLAAALLAALAGHVAEGFFGIAIVSTLLLTWLIAGLAGALAGLEPPEAAETRRTDRMSWGTTRQSVRAKQRTIGISRRVQTAPRTFVLFGLSAITCWIAWQVVSSGAVATAADAAARQGGDLEAVALANAGQAPLPVGRVPQLILSLRQFAGAAAAQSIAVRLMPGQEEYSLDAGKTLVEWAQAANDAGGLAREEAPALYARALLDFGRAARLNPYDPDPLRDTGKAYERWAGLGHDLSTPQTWNQDLLGRAAQAFALAARIAPHHPDPLTSEAQVALWQGRVNDAQALIAQALALDNQDGDGYRLRAAVDLQYGQRDATLSDWRRALADPNVSQRGATAAQLALAEATWAHARCTAVHDATMALAAGGAVDTARMAEILHVDAPTCHSARTSSS